MYVHTVEVEGSSPSATTREETGERGPPPKWHGNRGQRRARQRGTGRDRERRRGGTGTGRTRGRHRLGEPAPQAPERADRSAFEIGETGPDRGHAADGQNRAPQAATGACPWMVRAEQHARHRQSRMAAPSDPVHGGNEAGDEDCGDPLKRIRHHFISRGREVPSQSMGRRLDVSRRRPGERSRRWRARRQLVPQQPTFEGASTT